MNRRLLLQGVLPLAGAVAIVGGYLYALGLQPSPRAWWRVGLLLAGVVVWLAVFGVERQRQLGLLLGLLGLALSAYALWR